MRAAIAAAAAAESESWGGEKSPPNSTGRGCGGGPARPEEPRRGDRANDRLSRKRAINPKPQKRIVAAVVAHPHKDIQVEQFPEQKSPIRWKVRMGAWREREILPVYERTCTHECSEL